MEQFIIELKTKLAGEQIIQDEMLCYAYSTDASMYRMVPKVVVVVHSEREVIEVIKLASLHGAKLTFRAAGTSLSGQAVTDQVLVLLSNASWLNYTIHDAGSQISLEPGIIGAQANNYLLPYKRKIGPDPGSISAAKIGGIVANNSSGMCCGTSQNSYATLAHLRAVFANGDVLDSRDPRQVAKFIQDNQELINNIRHIRHQIINDHELSAFIRKKFAIKNTSGYSLNAFLDYEDPIQIIQRLLIGSEGTLAFVSQVTLNTVADEQFKALNLVYGTLQNLCDLTLNIAQFNISAIELLDANSLRSVAHIRELQPYLIEVDAASGAIMIELAAASADELKLKLAQVEAVIQRSSILQQTGFTQDAKLAATLWQARKGVLPTIAGQRPIGSSVLIEDVAVEIKLLPALIADLRAMFERYGYANAAIFGHVLAGNIHFVLTPNFTIAAELQAYDQFMHEFTMLVAEKYHGSLKAEHGSGRNIAPFALLEWGQQSWDIMWRIKELFDPQNILNPEVKLTRDNTLHMQHLKELPALDPQIDKCMECGFCEPVCPSRKLSLTPRQRNAVARRISQLSGAQRAQWLKKFHYYGIETCATTGMCQVACPVDIDTGAYILSLKPQKSYRLKHELEITQARRKLKLANLAAGIIGRKNLQGVTQVLHAQIKSIPVYLQSMPKVQTAKLISTRSNTPGNVLLIPSCPNRIFASEHGYGSYPLQALLERMGYAVSYPANVESLCCGQMYHSAANQLQQLRVQRELSHAIEGAQLVLMDNSSCAGFAKQFDLPIMDVNQFLVERLVRSKLVHRYQRLALHIDCSTAKHCFNPEFMAILRLCAYEIVIPEGIKCCGFAGDKGFTTPELNASSLSGLAAQVSDCEIGVTFNRSCQIGLNQHSGIKYISFIELILDCLKV